MLFKKTVYLLLIVSIQLSCASKKPAELVGRWEGSLQLSNEVVLPLVFEITVEGNDSTLILINDNERLPYNLQKGKGDNLKARLEPYAANCGLPF